MSFRVVCITNIDAWKKYSRESLYLRLSRQVLNLERAELAKKIGISESILKTWEIADKIPNQKPILELLDKLLGQERKENILRIIDEIKAGKEDQIQSIQET